MSVVELNGVCFRRGGHAILSEVDWTIESAQHWALLGANGSGKTTLLKILTGYEWPTTGSVSVLGRRYGECDLRELRKSIGWVSSALEHRIPARDTALEVAASGVDSSFGLYRAMDETLSTRARDALGRVEMEAFSDHVFETLSQGEQKRTLIARALINDPSVLVLDEPCAGLDPVSRDAFLESLGRLSVAEGGPTLILVTHHIEEIGPWLTHALVLKEGRALASGALDDVITGENMSAALARECRVYREKGKFRLEVRARES